jgi:hypothetical protein
VAETKRQRPAKKKQDYKHHTNAVCISVYHPMGESLSAEVQEELANSIWAVANRECLLINIAIT